jgi:hypothetical protein
VKYSSKYYANSSYGPSDENDLTLVPINVENALGKFLGKEKASPKS